jgi:hypothetical protein
VEHSKVIEAMKELSTARFVMLWIWLLVVAASPIGWLFVAAIAWRHFFKG